MILQAPWPQAFYLNLVIESSVADSDLELRVGGGGGLLTLPAFLRSAFF